MPATAAVPRVPEGAPNQWLVVGASSLGTVFEWYDFYLYGLLASVIGAQFFSGVNDVTAFIFALAAFAAGFAVRPFGALVFRPAGRPGRAQAHVPDHHEHHGRFHLRPWACCRAMPASA